jgi:hypothetical protein
LNTCSLYQGPTRTTHFVPLVIPNRWAHSGQGSSYRDYWSWRGTHSGFFRNPFHCFVFIYSISQFRREFLLYLFHLKPLLVSITWPHQIPINKTISLSIMSYRVAFES